MLRRAAEQGKLACALHDPLERDNQRLGEPVREQVAAEVVHALAPRVDGAAREIEEGEPVLLQGPQPIMRKSSNGSKNAEAGPLLCRVRLAAARPEFFASTSPAIQEGGL